VGNIAQVLLDITFFFQWCNNCPNFSRSTFKLNWCQYDVQLLLSVVAMTVLFWAPLLYFCLAVLSQCSTVMRNTVVRVTTKVNGKPQILGTLSPQTPESIDLKFDLDDYVGRVTLPAKNGTNRPSSVDAAKGWNIMFKNWLFFSFFLFYTFLAKLWETHFREYRRILCTGWRVSVGIDFLGGLNIRL